MKVWNHLCKLIKNQIDADRIVDTLHFGSFTLASTLSGNDAQKNYVYCPGPKAILQLVENEDNVAEIPQTLLDEKL